MKIILPYFAAFSSMVLAANVVAQATVPYSQNSVSEFETARSQSEARHPQSTGDQLLLQAIAQLERHESVAARLRHQSWLGDRRMFGAGSYWQQGSGDQLRVRLELQITGGETSLLHVSNGRYLWSDRRLPTGRSIAKIDLRRLRADAARAAALLDGQSPGQAAWTTIRPELAAYYAGLPKLLAALAESFSFRPPQAMRLTVEPTGAAAPIDLPVFATVGYWRGGEQVAVSTVAVSKVSESNDASDHLSDATTRMPREVLLLLGQSDLFPYRVEYRKRSQSSADHDSLPVASTKQPAPFQLSAEPLVLIEFSDVSFNVSIGPGQFDYAPPRDTKWNDLTSEYLDRLRRQREEKLATRRSEPTF
jgi:hypothetical protein